MIRVTMLLWVMLLAVAGGTVMEVSYQVGHVQKRLTGVVRDTLREKERIRLLKAEWETLSDPGRIDGLARAHALPLGPTPIARVVALEDIPLKPSDAQIDRMLADGAHKGGKDPAAARKAPETPMAAPRSPPIAIAARETARPAAPIAAPAPALDEVGLMLARIERRQ